MVSTIKKDNKITNNNLDRIRDIILGADLKVFDERLQVYAESIEKNRIYFKKRIKTIEEAAQKKDEKHVHKEKSLEETINTRVDNIELQLSEFQVELQDLKIRSERDFNTFEDFKAEFELKLQELNNQQETIVVLLEKELKVIKKKLEKFLKRELSKNSRNIKEKINAFNQEIALYLDDFQMQLKDILTKLDDDKLSRFALGESLMILGSQLIEKPETEQQEATKTKKKTTKRKTKRRSTGTERKIRRRNSSETPRKTSPSKSNKS